MPKYCCLRCKNEKSDAVRFFRFPTDAVRRQLWVQRCLTCRPDFEPSNNSRLCSRHFDSAQYESHRADGAQKLRPDAVPMLFELALHPVPLPTRIDNSWNPKRKPAAKQCRHNRNV
jgi:hypothetical protein